MLMVSRYRPWGLPLTTTLAISSLRNHLVYRCLSCDKDLVGSKGVPILFVAANWLVYLNSSLNPVIYNFMSGEQQRNINHVNETATLMT
ncbi:hypothetical protein C0Q70_16555 [Pomacea canaliculata]|uniref:G-protein coupled receptors family 1 profile domain-containing protein n=1 Tax=Pomacea canaliculata TaxID=400727 RepID=A0A2T7NQ38_POMCA|nr:hypothetical protein C0Q70_16555 [Pomacea canaliculata]